MTSQDFFLESPRCHRPWSSPCWFCQKSCLTSNSSVQGWGVQVSEWPPLLSEGLSSEERPSWSFPCCPGMRGGRKWAW